MSFDRKLMDWALFGFRSWRVRSIANPLDWTLIHLTSGGERLVMWFYGIGRFFFIRYFANFNLNSGYVVSSKPERCVCLVIWFQALSVLVKICFVMAVTANYFEQFWSIHSLIVQTTLKDFLRTFLEGAMALWLMPSTPKRGLELRPGTLFCVLGQLS